MELYESFYYMDNHFWFEQLSNFDNELQKSNGMVNPGTSADLLAASIII